MRHLNYLNYLNLIHFLTRFSKIYGHNMLAFAFEASGFAASVHFFPSGSINYRRSLYIAGGDVVATVATNESAWPWGFVGTKNGDVWIDTRHFVKVEKID